VSIPPPLSSQTVPSFSLLTTATLNWLTACIPSDTLTLDSDVTQLSHDEVTIDGVWIGNQMY
jgi:hypothetical protein